MFDFKLLVENLLLEAEPAIKDIRTKLQPFITLGETAFGEQVIDDATLQRVVNIALKGNWISVKDIEDSIPGTYLLYVILRLRELANPTAPTSNTTADTLFNDPNFNKYTTKLREEINKARNTTKTWPYESSWGRFNFISAYTKFTRTKQSIQQRLGFQVIEKYSNLPILPAVCNIVKDITKKDYTAFITDLFYNPAKYKSGGSVPQDLQSVISIDSLLLVALDAKDLYVELTKAPESVTETWWSAAGPAIALGVPLAMAVAKKLANARTANNLHSNSEDKVFTDFIKVGKLPDKTDTYTLNFIKDMNTDASKAFIEGIQTLGYYTTTGATKSQKATSTIGAAIDALGSGLGNSKAW